MPAATLFLLPPIGAEAVAKGDQRRRAVAGLVPVRTDRMSTFPLEYTLVQVAVSRCALIFGTVK